MNSSLESAIVSRRTVRDVKEDPISFETLGRILEKAAYAPFHSRREPWNVVVISDMEERQVLAKAVLDSYTRTGLFDNYTEAQTVKVSKATEDYYLGVPLQLIVSTEVFGDEIKDFESLGATCAFVQNIQLLCWEQGIGVVWRTNSYIFDRNFANDLGIPPNQRVVGSLHLGFPKRILKPKRRRPLAEWVSRLHDDKPMNLSE